MYILELLSNNLNISNVCWIWTQDMELCIISIRYASLPALSPNV